MLIYSFAKDGPLSATFYNDPISSICCFFEKTHIYWYYISVSVPPPATLQGETMLIIKMFNELIIRLMVVIKRFDDSLVSLIKAMTGRFVETKLGKLFLGLSLVGPFTFIPTVWIAWTAPNIDALRTLTWPMMVIINFSFLIALCYNGDWRVRFTMIMWMTLMSLVWMATVFR